MIGRQIKGRGFRGLLAYLHGKEGAEIVAGTLDGRTPRDLAREFGEVRRLRPNLSRAVFHMPVRPAPGEALSADRWREVAERIAAGMGFADAPWVAYLHRDAREEHLHLVASRITWSGEVVSDRHDYRRGMTVLRQIERDLGLALGPPDRAARKPPGLAELRSVPDGASLRAWLQVEIEKAASGRPRIGEFFARLDAAGIEAIPALDARGQPRGLSYRAGNGDVVRTFAGSTLGASFSFPGLVRRLGVRFDARRDLPLLADRRERALARSSRSPVLPEVPSMADPRPGPGSLPPPQDPHDPRDPIDPRDPSAPPDAPDGIAALHLSAIRRQLRALDAPRVDLLLVEARTGEREIRSGLSINDLERALDELRDRNARGAEILFRPAGDAKVVLVTDVPRSRLADLGKKDLDPAVVVDLANARSDVWFRHREPLPAAEADLVQALLAREVRGRAAPEPERFGHLAGFRTPLGSPERSDREDAAHLRHASTREYERGDEFREEARTLLLARSAERDLAREGPREIEAALDRAARDPLDGPGLRLERGLDLESTLASWRAARDQALALRTTPVEPLDPVEPDRTGSEALAARESAIVEAYRRLGEIESALEEATGLRPLPAHLDGEALARAADLVERWGRSARDLDRAEDRAEAAPTPAIEAIRDERAIASAARGDEALAFAADRSLRFDLAPGLDLAEAALDRPLPEPADFAARSRALDEALAHLGSDPGPVERGALADAFAAKLDTELAVEAIRLDLARAARALAVERDDLVERLGRFERLAADRPLLAGALERRWSVDDRLERVEDALAAVRARLGEAELLSTDRALERSGLTLTGEKTVWDTAGGPYRRYAEALERRLELSEQIAGRDPLLAAEVRPPETPELARAREELSARAARLLDDRTPDALAAYRSAAERLGALKSAGRDRTVEVDFETARRDLDRALRALTTDPGARETGRLEPAAVERFRTALDRFQAAEEQLAGRLSRPAPGLGSDRRSDLSTDRSADRSGDRSSDQSTGRSAGPDATGRGARGDRFAELFERLKKGDRTPDTLADLHRAVARELRGQSPAVKLDEPAPSKLDLLGRLDRFRRARVEISWQLHRHSEEISRREPAALARFQGALSRYQNAAQDLDRGVDRFVRDPERRILPVRFFLRHPKFERAPHRALAAWARHARERGLSPAQLRAHLSRSAARGRQVRPGLFRGPWVTRAAFWGTRWAGRTLRRLVHEEVRSR